MQRISNTFADGSIKEPGGQASLFARANQLWHTDSSFREVPAMASLLSTRILPPDNPDTEFVSTRTAFEALGAEVQAELADLIVIHSIVHSREKLSPDAVNAEQRQALPPAPQALVRTNPVTGRKSLLIGSHVAGIVGMADEEAQALNEKLVAIATQPELIYRHRWSDGDLIMWDNRAVLHRSHPFDDANEIRLLMRTTLAGLGPTVVDGQIVEAR
jgi:alpha-ketoglutarate-dependent 2,4-dichlorophenoxyacetate dioxygenase